MLPGGFPSYRIFFCLTAHPSFSKALKHRDDILGVHFFQYAMPVGYPPVGIMDLLVVPHSWIV